MSLADLAVLPPGSVLVFGAPLLALLRGRALQAGLVLLPILSLLHLLLGFEVGDLVHLRAYGMELTPVRFDALARLFGLVFHVAAIAASVYALHVTERLQHVTALTYAGAAVAAVSAGDLVSLFVWWEVTALASVFLIWATGTDRSFRAGMRYLLVQVLSGVLLMAGVLVRQDAGLGIAFGPLGLTGSVDTTLIFLAFGIKAAFPLLHAWLPDAYPEATPTGTVWLSAFTTKLAIYALARGFPGTELLLPIGATMAVLPILLAILTDDLRRVLAYGLVSQLGFMVVGVGIGTDVSLNGTAAHAAASTLYQSLLFMSTGAVLMRTGTAKASELGGLWRSMPWTLGFGLVGAASIAGLPLFAGFPTKSIILTASAAAHVAPVYLALQLAAAGVVHHSGIKVPYLAFFARDRGLRVAEAPLNALVAMGLVAAGCVLIGVWPGALYALLPYPVTYVPYTIDHVVTVTQLMLGAALAFALLLRLGELPVPRPSAVLDVDWVYRRLLPQVAGDLGRVVALVRAWFAGWIGGLQERAVAQVYRSTGPGSAWARTWSTGEAALSVAVVLTLYALLFFRMGEDVVETDHAPVPPTGGAQEHRGGH